MEGEILISSDFHLNAGRSLWTAAVKRLNPDGTAWQPTVHSRICGAHFVTGRPSKFATHPDYVPTIFTYRKAGSDADVRRHNRASQRQESQRAATVASLSSQEDPTALPGNGQPAAVIQDKLRTDVCDLIGPNRLLGSKTGRKILEKLGYEPKHEQVRSRDIPRQIRDKIKIPPLPRNMNPAFHDGRRKDRAEALQTRYTGRQDVLYTDAAEYDSKAAYAAVAVREDRTPMACCKVIGVETVEAEEVAIALAVSQRGAKVVISDSKNAERNYESGRVTETAIRILNRDGGPRPLVLLVWAPAHQGLRGNEEAH
ncbi:hypothetical protein HPB49_021536 [Dermacentor silvarum]|uniref:Uncharacterized protein n=1 Tax=Dermacentor silvarum TaxID=543639 RepID=A0ACB8DG76_DERSI|nr:hypothetical protein HPB49_021536 [Dermacentor silvarum]